MNVHLSWSDIIFIISTVDIFKLCSLPTRQRLSEILAIGQRPGFRMFAGPVSKDRNPVFMSNFRNSTCSELVTAIYHLFLRSV